METINKQYNQAGEEANRFLHDGMMTAAKLLLPDTSKDIGLGLANALKSKMQHHDLDAEEFAEYLETSPQEILKMLQGNLEKPELWIAAVQKLAFFDELEKTPASPLLPKPVDVRALPNFQLFIQFEDGLSGTISVERLQGVGVFKQWDEQPDLFEAVYLDGGAIAWSELLQLSADALYLKIKTQEQY